MWRKYDHSGAVHELVLVVNKLEAVPVWERKRLSQCDCKWPKQADSLSSGKKTIVNCLSEDCAGGGWLGRCLMILYDSRTSEGECKSKIQLNKWSNCPTV